MSLPLTFVIFDLLRRDGVDLTSFPYVERRQQLEGLKLYGRVWTTCERFDDGRALFAAVCELGFEGVIAKNHSSLYRPNDRGWVKVKNPNYWRRDAEQRGHRPKHERRAKTKRVVEAA
jgi:bifunctional non-homologous end joining protein LigD